MAEDEAERAFFQTQASAMENYETGENQEVGGSDSDEYDPSKTVENEYSGDIENSHAAVPSYSHVVGFSAPDSVQRMNVSNDYSQDQDSSGAFPSSSPSRSESRASTQMHPSNPSGDQNTQVKDGSTQEEEIGEDDGGDAEYEPPGAVDLVQDTANTPADIQQRSLFQNLNENVSPFHVSQQQTVSDKTTPLDVSNNSSSLAPPAGTPLQNNFASKPDDTGLAVPSIAQSAASSIAATPTPIPIPKGRLPHDRVGILEDRIQADPRGDTEAWLELIDEHRSRNKLDAARQVYERFFKVFPWAVSRVAFDRLTDFEN